MQVPWFLSKESSLLSACVVRYYFITASQPRMAASRLESVARDRRKQGFCLLDSVNQKPLLKGHSHWSFFDCSCRDTVHMSRTPLPLEQKSVTNCSAVTLSLSSRFFNYEMDSNDFFYPCKKMQFVLSLRLNSRSFLLRKTQTNKSHKSSEELSYALKYWDRIPSAQSSFTQLPSPLHLSQGGCRNRKSSRNLKLVSHIRHVCNLTFCHGLLSLVTWYSTFSDTNVRTLSVVSGALASLPSSF